MEESDTALSSHSMQIWTSSKTQNQRTYKHKNSDHQPEAGLHIMCHSNSKPHGASAIYLTCAIRNYSQSCPFLCPKATHKLHIGTCIYAECLRKSVCDHARKVSRTCQDITLSYWKTICKNIHKLWQTRLLMDKNETPVKTSSPSKLPTCLPQETGFSNLLHFPQSTSSLKLNFLQRCQ